MPHSKSDTPTPNSPTPSPLSPPTTSPSSPTSSSPTSSSTTSSSTPNSEDGNPVETVFAYWVATCRNHKGPKPVLSDKRKRIIKKAIEMYGIQTCLEAIVGCTKSEWHMGNNPRGRRYDAIELIFRDAEKIEQFAGYFYEDDATDPFSNFA